MTMHYAKCCRPLLGNKIVRIMLHTCSGMTIYISDCEILNNFAGMLERIIDLTWDSNASNITFVCRVSIVLLNASLRFIEVKSVESIEKILIPLRAKKVASYIERTKY